MYVIVCKGVYHMAFHDNGKLIGRLGRKAKGPRDRQPATEREVFAFTQMRCVL